MKTVDIFKNSKSFFKRFGKGIYKLSVLTGGFAILFVILDTGNMYRSDSLYPCEDAPRIFRWTCHLAKLNNKFSSQVRNLRNLDSSKRLSKKSAAKRFSKFDGGFEFSYPKNTLKDKGYLLLSRPDPENINPRIELWNLNSQTKVHEWNIDKYEIHNSTSIEKGNYPITRLIHPLMLEDGSIISGSFPSHKDSELLKFDQCGKLTKVLSGGYGFHHSIEMDKDGLVYVPVAKTMLKSEYYKNYENHSDLYRPEGIAILDKKLNIKRILPLDEIFYSAGLLQDLNNPLYRYLFKLDPSHLNDVHPFIDSSGEKILYLSMRHYGVMAYNLTKSRVDWVLKSATFLQHDISPVPNTKNTVSIFDNGAEENTPLGEFKGNTLLTLKIPKYERTKYFLGNNLEKQGLQVKRYDFTNLPKELIPNTQEEGRGSFADNKTIFIEETLNGRAFAYDINEKKIIWSFYNKNKTDKTPFLSWSRHYPTIPQTTIERLNQCPIDEIK